MHSYRNQSIDLQCKLIGTTQFICSANQLTDFYNSITLAWYRSIRALWKYIFQGTNAKFQKQSPGGVLEKSVLKISPNSQENTYARVSLLIKLQATVCNFIKKDTLAQVFACECCEISKNTFSTEHLRVTASEIFRISL